MGESNVSSVVVWEGVVIEFVLFLLGSVSRLVVGYVAIDLCDQLSREHFGIVPPAWAKGRLIASGALAGLIVLAINGRMEVYGMFCLPLLGALVQTLEGSE